jgi:uncharacterized YccA/Bax inhibitor family protein
VQLEKMYAAPSATSVDTGRVTVDDVVVKTGIQFVLLLASAAVAWQATSGDVGRAMSVWLISMFAGLGLGLVIAFKRNVSVPLIIAYAVVEGVFVGTISQVFDNMLGAQYDGVVAQAVIGTLAVFGGMLAAYKTGLIKVNDKFRRMMMFALVGYALVAVASLIGAFMGVGGGWGFYGVGGLGLLLCIAGVGLASVMLALDFDNIDRAVAAGLPQKYSWLLGHGLLVTLVWLYIEILRLLAILRGDN